MKAKTIKITAEALQELIEAMQKAGGDAIPLKRRPGRPRVEKGTKSFLYRGVQFTLNVNGEVVQLVGAFRDHTYTTTVSRYEEKKAMALVTKHLLAIAELADLEERVVSKAA